MKGMPSDATPCVISSLTGRTSPIETSTSAAFRLPEHNDNDTVLAVVSSKSAPQVPARRTSATDLPTRDSRVPDATGVGRWRPDAPVL